MKRKYIVILGDGMADYPDDSGNTPLTLANKPFIDSLAPLSQVGLCQTVPVGMKPGSDTANLSVLGYDPRECYTGRSPLEAVSMGIALGDRDVTYRCNLVTLGGEGGFADKTMADYSAGEISTAEAAELIGFLQKNLELNGAELYAGVSYRHCLVRREGQTGAALTPPHDISGQKIGGYLPRGRYEKEFLALTEQSHRLLKTHPLNIERVKQGKNPANSVWLWGEGTKPRLQSFEQMLGLKGAVISAVDLIKGIGLCAKMQSIDVAGATGTVHTNFKGKADAAIEALKACDFVYVHLEAPDECGHQGDRAGKIRAIELIDEKVVRPVVTHLQNIHADFSLLFVPDHATPLSLKTHVSDPVPYLIYKSGKSLGNGAKSYDEAEAKKTGATLCEGRLLVRELIK